MERGEGDGFSTRMCTALRGLASGVGASVWRRGRNVRGLPERVLDVVSVYQDGRSHFAYLTLDGQFIVVTPACSPRFGVDLDSAEARCEMRPLPAARTLSLSHINSARRGIVYSGNGHDRNGKRLAGHVIREEAAERYVLQRLPKHDHNAAPHLLSLPQTAVRYYAPMLSREYYSKKAANTILPFLEALFRRADHSDGAVCDAMHPHSPPPRLDVLGALVTQLAQLRAVMRAQDYFDWCDRKSRINPMHVAATPAVASAIVDATTHFSCLLARATASAYGILVKLIMV